MATTSLSSLRKLPHASLYPKSEGFRAGYWVIADFAQPDGKKVCVTLSRELADKGTLRRVLKRIRRFVPNARGSMNVLLP